MRSHATTNSVKFAQIRDQTSGSISLMLPPGGTRGSLFLRSIRHTWALCITVTCGGSPRSFSRILTFQPSCLIFFGRRSSKGIVPETPKTIMSHLFRAVKRTLWNLSAPSQSDVACNGRLRPELILPWNSPRWKNSFDQFSQINPRNPPCHFFPFRLPSRRLSGQTRVTAEIDTRRHS